MKPVSEYNPYLVAVLVVFTALASFWFGSTFIVPMLGL